MPHPSSEHPATAPTMQAFGVRKYGEPLERMEVARPRAIGTKMLVRVTAASVNPIDDLVRQGQARLLSAYSLPQLLGHDVAGVVEEVGPQVTEFKVGDRVFARPRSKDIGGFAEYIAVEQADAAPSPEQASDVEAASLPLAVLTAWQTLFDRAGLHTGQRVLIHAGSGGVGTLAIQLARRAGAHVTTTASGRNEALLRELGAHEVIDYHTQDFAELPQRYDVILDGLGPRSVARSLRVIRPGGVVVSICGPFTPQVADEIGAGKLAKAAFGAMSLKTRLLARRAKARYVAMFMEPSGEQLREVARLVDAGELRPVVGVTFPFEQAPEALEALGSSKAPGKIVVEGASARAKEERPAWRMRR